jgi:hypothetical protein
MSRDSRDLVFTTLIDLLVQIIFIFTIVIVVLPGAGKAETERESPQADLDPFKRLVYALFKDSTGGEKRSMEEVAVRAELKQKELEDAQRELKKIKAELESKRRLKGEGSAPGLERCVVAGRQGKPLFRIRYFGAGSFKLEGADYTRHELSNQGDLSVFDLPESPWSSLRPRLEPIAAVGRGRGCTFVLEWEHVAGLDADDILSARMQVERQFYLTSPKLKTRPQ